MSSPAEKPYGKEIGSKYHGQILPEESGICLLYTSDAADERSSVDLGGRRIIKKKTTLDLVMTGMHHNKCKQQ